MTFLAPLFLVGAAAIGFPIIFHLIRRTTREQTPFSSLMFLLPSPPRLTRRSRLEHILLLLFRCLVLCLLALGFARPLFKQTVQGDYPSGPARRLVILVDTSASMRRANLWPDARAKAEALLNKTSISDQVALFTFDRQPAQLISFEQWNDAAPAARASMAARKLAEQSPCWGATYLGQAL